MQFLILPLKHCKFFTHADDKTYAVTNESFSLSTITQMGKYGNGKGKVIKLVISYLSQFEGILLIFNVFPSINDNNAWV